MKVSITQDALDYLDILNEVLFEKNYFGFRESAKEYTAKMIRHCFAYIPILPNKKAPERFRRYGWPLYYITYKPNKNTNWYIFYIKHENRYLVTYITNNHTNAQHIRGLK